MSSKEIKALIEVGTTLGYKGEDLKQFVHDERMRMDREKEVEAEKQRKFCLLYTSPSPRDS